MPPTHDQLCDAILKSPSYRLAEDDVDLLARHELRPVRLQLELLKPELIQQDHDIHSTIVVFGGARIMERGLAEQRLAAARQDSNAAPDRTDLQRAVRTAERLLAKSRYYDEAREFARIVSSTCQLDGRCEFVIVTGGGPGIMEAANRGAFDVGAKSIGYNITLPHEQAPNPFITPDLCFRFHYFAIRKMHFLLRARALLAFPGGFGTMDELFEALTLIQTGKSERIPIILFGRDFWNELINWNFFVDEGVISPEDLDLIHYAETAQQAWDIVARHHPERIKPASGR
ncbi:MAG: TIGR00730 family Rossman fold protein [Phycisphaerales bacterium]|nr:TIGR00730 family Rossman fold protein [Phycisphaerales bacterium]